MRKEVTVTEDRKWPNNTAFSSRGKINAKITKAILKTAHFSEDLALLYIKTHYRAAWVAQSVGHPTLAHVMISQFMGSSLALGSVLTAQSLEPRSCFGFCVSLCLCLSPASVLSVCLSVSLRDK